MHAISDTDNLHSESMYMSSESDQIHLPPSVGKICKAVTCTLSPSDN